MEYFYTYILGAAIVCAFLGNYIAKQKNRSTTEGVLFGLIGGILGLIIVVLLPSKEKKAPARGQRQRGSTAREIQKAKDSDFLSNMLGWFILIVVIVSIVYAGL